MAELTLFKSRVGASTVVTPNGVPIHFIGGVAYPSDEAQVAYLQELADTPGIGVYIDKTEPTIDTEAVTPYEKLKAKLRQEVMEEIAAVGRNVAPTLADSETLRGQNSATDGSARW